jgi:hypothetical protein
VDEAWDEWDQPQSEKFNCAGGVLGSELAGLVGIWWDSRGSRYEVSPCTPQSLSVLTRRRTGEVRFTKGLICIQGEAARPAVVWGQGYVLNLPFGGGAEPATISWLPKPGPVSQRLRKFEWSRAAPDTFPEDVLWFWKNPTTRLEDTYGSDTDPP